jgi:hypothetical protein
MELQEWLDANTWVFDSLGDSVTGLAKAAGDAGRAHGRSPTSVETHAALSIVGDKATALLALIARVQALPPIPDPDTGRPLFAGLARWSDAAGTMQLAAGRRDEPEVQRSARALDAGTDEFLRAAAALRRVTGQPPDPVNPFS